MVDLFHLQHIRGDVTNSLKKFAPYIGHVQVSTFSNFFKHHNLIDHFQIAQSPYRHEPDTDGELNLKYVLKTLEQHYDDYVGCEYRPVSATVDGLKWIKDFGYEL